MNMDLIIYGLPKIAQYGETVVGNSYEYAPGGKGGNQAIAVAKLGGNSNMVGAVGTDSNGNSLINNLKASGVNTTYVEQSDQHQTGLATMNIDEETARYVSYMIMGGNDKISLEQVEQAIDSEEIDMILMQLEMPLDVVYGTYQLAKERNIPVFLDAGPAKKIQLEKLKGIFIISPNEFECETLTDIPVDSEENARKAAKKLYDECSPQYVLLKLGSRGVLLYDGKDFLFQPSFKVSALDTTAAGDTFGAAFAVTYCNGGSMEKSLTYGQAAAAICVSRKGGQEAIPTLPEVEAFLNNQ